MNALWGKERRTPLVVVGGGGQGTRTWVLVNSVKIQARWWIQDRDNWPAEACQQGNFELLPQNEHEVCIAFHSRISVPFPRVLSLCERSQEISQHCPSYKCKEAWCSEVMQRGTSWDSHRSRWTAGHNRRRMERMLPTVECYLYGNIRTKVGPFRHYIWNIHLPTCSPAAFIQAKQKSPRHVVVIWGVPAPEQIQVPSKCWGRKILPVVRGRPPQLPLPPEGHCEHHAVVSGRGERHPAEL
jgi:hypothetical protein